MFRTFQKSKERDTVQCKRFQRLKTNFKFNEVIIRKKESYFLQQIFINSFMDRFSDVDFGKC